MAASGWALGADEYPAARRGSQVDDYFGQKVTDPYRWMEDIDSPETTAWVAAERAFTAAAFSGMPERAAIGARFRELWNFPKFGLPIRRAGKMFYTKNDGLQNQAVLYVIDGPGAAPRVLIDPNALSRARSPSPTSRHRATGRSSATAWPSPARTGTSSTFATWRRARTGRTSSAG
jgi:prolyl oligopeptidase